MGITCFVILYAYSSTLYPGGSQLNADSKGYDWINNYWCNLMSEIAVNGQINPSRSYAILAMIILSISMLIFFVRFADISIDNYIWNWSFKICAFISMILAALIFTQYHDLMTILSSLFGIVVVIGVIRELYSSKLLFCKISALLCLLLLALNNFIYYSKYYIDYLPLLQKITFAIVLIWVIMLNYNLQKINKG